MRVAYQDLDICQGSTHEFELVIFEDDDSQEPADLTGFDVRASIREEYSSPNPSIEFICSIGPITALENFEGDAGNHAINLKLTAAETQTLIEHDYVYDVELYIQDSNGENVVYRVLEGKIYVKPSVTR